MTISIEGHDGVSTVITVEHDPEITGGAGTVDATIDKRTVDELTDSLAGDADLLDELKRLRVENARLLEVNRGLRLALDSYVARARSTSLFGPVEMTAGTCVGSPRHPWTRR